MDVRRLAAVALTLPLLALSACTDEGSGKEPSPDPSSTSPTPTVTDKGPSIPPEAMGDDEESAKAFVKYYFATLSEAMVSGETSLLEQLSTDGCRTCRGLIDKIANLYAKNGSIVTSGWKAERPTLLPSRSGAESAFIVRVRVSPERLLDERGGLVSRTPGDLVPMRVELLRRPRHWAVKEIVNLR